MIKEKHTNKRLRIGFLSQYSPNDRKASSGTNYKMAEQLSAIGDLEWIRIEISWIGKILLKISRGMNRLFGTHLMPTYTKFGARQIYKNIGEDLLNNYDVIAAFFCMPVLACIKTSKPIIYFTDATFPVMIDYYPEFSGLCNLLKKAGIALEKAAMDNADKVIVSSKWAAKSAIADLQQDETKVHIIEFGANIDESDLIDKKFHYDGHLNLLFLGVDWKRKGGDIAVEAVKWLNENGIPSTLYVVGIKNLDEQIADLQYVNNIGFLNKNIPEQYSRLVEIIKDAHCLLLPTLAECSAIAFAESSAFGLPVFTFDTGGVSNYINNGINGYMFPLGTKGRTFGRKIKESLQNEELALMSTTAQQFYKEKLNWTVWGKKVQEAISQVTKNK